MKTICINGCSREVAARGLCRSCYNAAKRAGTLALDGLPPVRKHALTNIDPEQMLADCAEDGRVKVTPRDKDHTGWQCSIRANAGKRAWKRRLYRPKAAVLGDNCEICGDSDVKLCWDHDHKTGAFRGTLCNSCNLAIGLLRDDLSRIREAYAYLARFQ